MIIYPAIDLRAGKVVRLKEGDPNRQAIFSNDPIATALRWIDEGATWLHIVNLDGAFASANQNEHILEAIAKLNVDVQFGGGLRTKDDVSSAIEAGASRVVLGTVAVENPELVSEVIERWGTDRLCIALDARNGKVTTRGWQVLTELSPVIMGQNMASLGVVHALYTDVSRDGGLQGVNVEATETLARETGLKVIASGGVSSPDDIQELYKGQMVAGVVIGMALYEGKINLREAIQIAVGNDAV